MKIISRIVRIILGWLHIGTSKLENANIDAIIANLEAEKDKASSKIFDKMVSIKTSINEMEKKARKLKEDSETLDKRSIQALENGKEELASEFALKFENTNRQYQIVKTNLDAAKVTYDDLMKNQNKIIETFDNRIQQIKLKAISVDMNTELANIKDIANLSGDNSMMGMLNDADKILDKKDSKATAAIEVSDTLNQSKNDLEDFEASMDKNEALERLKARQASKSEEN